MRHRFPLGLPTLTTTSFTFPVAERLEFYASSLRVLCESVRGDGAERFPVADACSGFSTCEECNAGCGCGWCAESQTCMEGDPTGAHAPNVCNIGAWDYYTCANCQTLTTCSQCETSSLCGWCADLVMTPAKPSFNAEQLLFHRVSVCVAAPQGPTIQAHVPFRLGTTPPVRLCFWVVEFISGVTT